MGNIIEVSELMKQFDVKTKRTGLKGSTKRGTVHKIKTTTTTKGDGS